jgi:hypothetical protein
MEWSQPLSMKGVFSSVISTTGSKINVFELCSLENWRKDQLRTSQAVQQDQMIRKTWTFCCDDSIRRKTGDSLHHCAKSKLPGTSSADADEYAFM